MTNLLLKKSNSVQLVSIPFILVEFYRTKSMCQFQFNRFSASVCSTFWHGARVVIRGAFWQRAHRRVWERRRSLVHQEEKRRHTRETRVL